MRIMKKDYQVKRIKTRICSDELEVEHYIGSEFYLFSFKNHKIEKCTDINFSKKDIIELKNVIEELLK